MAFNSGFKGLIEHAASIAHKYAPCSVTIHSEEHSILEFCVVQFEIWIDPEPYITVFTTVKRTRRPSFTLYLRERHLPGQ